MEGASIKVRVRVGSLWCNRRMSPLHEFVQQRLARSAEVETPISVDVIRMHLYFDGFSDEPIHVASF